MSFINQRSVSTQRNKQILTDYGVVKGQTKQKRQSLKGGKKLQEKLTILKSTFGNEMNHLLSFEHEKNKESRFLYTETKLCIATLAPTEV